MAQKFTVPITVKQLTSASSDAVTVFVDADTYARLKIEAGGRLVWGSGSGTGDVNLYRDGADVLKTDDTFKTPTLFVDNIEIDTTGATSNQVLKFDGTKFVPGTASTVGSIDDLSDVDTTTAAPTTNQYLKWNGTNWIPSTVASGGATISDTLPSSPTNGQIWYESDTGKTFVYYDSFWVEIVGSTGAQGPTGAEGGTTTLTTKGDLLTRSASAVSRLPVGATNGHVLTVDSAETSGMKWAAAVGGMTELDAQTFTSSTTYTVVAGAKLILVECVAAGSGGTGGARNTGTTGTTGSSGGSGGAWEQVSIPVSELGGAGASVTVTIGAGGAGGAGRTGSTGSGIAGSIGGDSRFGTYYFGGAKLQSAYGLVSGYVQVLTDGYGYRGSGGGVGGSGGGGGRSGFRGGAGGGGGGSITTITRSGGEGGGYSTQPTSTSTLTYIATSGGGAAGGAAGGGAGAAGASFGIGGGGGGSSNTATGGAGGAGGTGAGGGGGGNANGDNDGGAGGAGGNAQIKIWVFG